MDIIDFELRRYDQWKEDMEKRRKQFENTTGLTFFPMGNNDNCDRKIKIIDDIWNMEGPLDYEVKKRSADVLSLPIKVLKVLNKFLQILYKHKEYAILPVLVSFVRRFCK